VSKGARLRKQRASVQPAKPRVVLPRVPQDVLFEAVVAVGDAFGSAPRCAEAAAVLWETARLLGYALEVRPVSLLIHDETRDTWGFMGPKASALIPDEVRSDVVDLRPNGQDNGHVVLTREEPTLLLDPNLRQLASYEIAAPSLVLNIRSTHPEDGRWSAELEGLRLMYIDDPDNLALVARWDDVVRRFASESAYLAEMLRAGATADTMRGLLH